MGPAMPAMAAGRKSGEDHVEDRLNSVLFPGGSLGNAPELGKSSYTSQSSYSREFAIGRLDPGVLVAARDFGILGDGRLWHSPAPGVTHGRIIAHESEDSESKTLQTSHASMAPDNVVLAKTLKRSLHQAAMSREAAKSMGGVPYEEIERRWRRWRRRRESGSCVGSAAFTASAT